MQNLLQFGLSISVLCNCFTIWGLWKVIRSQGDHLDSLTKLVMMIAESHPNFQVIKGNVIPFNLKK